MSLSLYNGLVSLLLGADWVFPIIFPGGMATNYTAPAGLAIGVFQSNRKFFLIGYAGADVFGLVRGMDVMTGHAGPAIFFAIDMQEMEIVCPVTEPGFHAFAVEIDLAVMAIETEFIVGYRKIFGKVLCEVGP